MSKTNRPGFTSDYMEGAHPTILQRLVETNMVQAAGYGCDEFSEAAREKIRAACGAPDAEIHFLAGGTQTNMTVISAMLRPYQGVVAAETGHIALRAAGPGYSRCLPWTGNSRRRLSLRVFRPMRTMRTATTW